MTRLTGLVLLVVSMSCASLSLPRAGRPTMPDVQFKMRELRLPNGMRVIAEEEKGSPVVGIFSLIGSGSTSDPVGREGLAHLVEHLAFRGKPDGNVTWKELLDQAGASTWNAQTSFDMTMYYSAGPTELYEQLLTIEANRLVALVKNVDKKTLDVEREVVRNELRQRGEMAIGPEFAWLQSAVFPEGHAYHRPVVGTHQSLDAITLEDVQAFVEKHYRPDNITMVVMGNLDLASFDKVLDRRFPAALYGIPATPASFAPRLPAQVKEPPAPPSEVLSRHVAGVITPELYVAWSLPRAFEETAALVRFLSFDANSELGDAWRHDEDITGVQVFPVEGVEASMLVARIALKQGTHPEASMDHVLNTLVMMATSGDVGREYSSSATTDVLVRERDFSRLRGQVMMSQILEAQSVMVRGPERVFSTHFSGDPFFYSKQLRVVDQLSGAKVSAFAARYLTRERARGVLVSPFPADAKPTLGTTGLSDPLQGEISRVNYPVQAVKDLTQRWLEGAREEVLPSGLKVEILRRPGLPVVSVVLALPSGDAVGKKGAGRLAQSFARAKLATYGHAYDFGIDESRELLRDAQVFSADGANGNLPNILAQLSVMLPSLHVDATRVQEAAPYYFPSRETQERLPELVAARELQAALFPDSRLGETVVTKDLREVSGGEANEWLTQRVVPRGGVLTIVGDVDPEKALGQVKEWLGSWSGGGDETLFEAPRGKPAQRVLVTARPGATQVEIAVGCRTPKATPKTLAAQEILVDRLSSDLNRVIRENLGASYGIHGRADVFRGGSTMLTVGGSVDVSRIGAVLKVFDNLWVSFGAKQLGEKDLGAGRWAVARHDTQVAESAGGLARSLALGLLRGRTAQEQEGWAETLAGVTRADLREAWAACAESSVFSLVGDPTLVNAAVPDRLAGKAPAPTADPEPQ